MLKIPPQILLLYDEMLVKSAVPERSHFLYKKWLRYYLDFCHKYRLEPSKGENLSRFLSKLKNKKQSKDQQKQAAHAISIYHEIRRLDSGIKGTDKARKTRKHLPSPNTSGKSLTSAGHSDVKTTMKIREGKSPLDF